MASYNGFFIFPKLSPEAQGVLNEVGSNIRTGFFSLVIPTAILYLALYALVKKKLSLFEKLDLLAILAFLCSSFVVVLECSAVRSLQLFAVAICIMKALDFYARRYSPPKYAYPDRPSDSIMAFLYLTELRYESFTPNFLQTAPANLGDDPSPNFICRHQKKSHGTRSPCKKSTIADNNSNPHTQQKLYQQAFFFSEPVNLILHATFFLALQVIFPQSNPTVLAVQILLAVYVLWESLQLILRYRTSPPLFGPLYTAVSLGTFWSETWHTAFASPCRSLVYEPLRRTLPRKYGVPVSFARAIGIVASFALMGVFHAYALAPLLPVDALARVCAFFLLNGIGTVIEDAVWGRHMHWGKTLLAWVFELGIASWTVEGLSVPKGLRNVAWSSICDVGRDKDFSTIF